MVNIQQIIPQISKKNQNMFIGGLAGSLVNYVEQYMNDRQTWYPAILHARLDGDTGYMPRNGKLLVEGAPFAVGFALTKKGKTERAQALGMGMVLYDLPKLMHSFITSATWKLGYNQTGGTPPPRGRLNLLPSPIPSPLMIQPSSKANTARQVSSGGRYSVGNKSPTSTSGNVGRYTVMR